MKDLSPEERFNQSLKRISKKIADKRRDEILYWYNADNTLKELNYKERLHNDGLGHGQAHWRKIAQLPEPVLDFLQTTYGSSIIKDRDFWKNKDQQMWATVDKNKL